jgi:hypothetical protein
MRIGTFELPLMVPGPIRVLALALSSLCAGCVLVEGVGDWESCVREKAAEYAKSEDSAELAATVAVFLCRPVRPANFSDDAEEHVLETLPIRVMEERAALSADWLDQPPEADVSP